MPFAKAGSRFACPRSPKAGASGTPPEKHPNRHFADTHGKKVSIGTGQKKTARAVQPAPCCTLRFPGGLGIKAYFFFLGAAGVGTVWMVCRMRPAIL